MTRYSRQELFAPIGPEGQAKLRAARVLVVGCGALGSALAETLTRAGVGRLTVVDRDLVEPSNLQRQSLFDEDDAAQARPKAVAAEARLRRINSDVEVTGLVADLDAAHGRGPGARVRSRPRRLGQLRDPVRPQRRLPARGRALGVRRVRGGPWRGPRRPPRATPCLRCVVGEKPAPGSGETCDTVGVVAPIVQVVAGIQGAEALKLLAGDTASLLPGLVTVDLWAGTFEVTDLSGREPWCPSCVEGRYDYATASASGGWPRSSAAARRSSFPPARRWTSGPWRLDCVPPGRWWRTSTWCRFRSPEAELVVFADGRAIVKGVTDAAGARSVFARYVGA